MQQTRLKPQSQTSGVKVLDKAFDLLESIGANEKGSSLSELAAQLKMPVGTVHRLLQHLTRRSYIEQDPASKLYFLGLRVLVLRGQAIQSVQLAARARPFLVKLMSAANCVAHLAVYRDGQTVYVDRVETPKSADVFIPAGKRAPANTVALGKIFLAALSPAELDAYFANAHLAKPTKNTLSEPRALKEHLRLVRERGYALDVQEAEIGVWCVAAPIRDYTGRVVAALSVSMREEPGPARVDALIQLVTQTALSVSQTVGFQPSAVQASIDLQMR